MPRISAPTVREHREAVHQRLVDAAEALLRTRKPDALTAGAVTAQAGIARNSIYRYVDSIDDLRSMVLARYLPRWLAAVRQKVDPITDPRERILEWVSANLEQAQLNGHGWLMDVARTAARLDRGFRGDLDAAHALTQFLTRALAEVGGDHQVTRALMIRSLVDAGFRALDAGQPLDEVEALTRRAVDSVL